MRGKFSFLYVDIWFDATKCKFITKNSSFKMLVVFLPIFVAQTKIKQNFVAPLSILLCDVINSANMELIPLMLISEDAWKTKN